MSSEQKIAVFVPTYNESGNVEELCARLLDLPLSLKVVFLDDNSPDGTGDILERLAKENSLVTVIHRDEKSGIGSAHQEGITWAYSNKIDILITMDSDFTHLPEDIPRFIENSLDCDVVIGSRYMTQKSLVEWNLFRKLMTIGGHVLTLILLRMKYDASGAFRLYNLNNISEIAFAKVISTSYSFFFESLYVLNVNKYRINEIPILLPARTYGSSKMTFHDAYISIRRLFQLSLLTMLNRKRYIFEASALVK